MNVRLEPVIDIEGETYSKTLIKSMSFEQFKMIASNIDDFKTLYAVANWHSDDAIYYVQELKRGCNIFKY